MPQGAVVTGVVTATSGSFSGNVTSGGINAVGVVTATSFVGDGAGLTGVSSLESYDSWLFGGGG